MSDKFEWGTFHEQLEYLKERGLDEITIRRLGLEICTETRLATLGIKWKEPPIRGIIWHLRDISGKLTGKLGARVWYRPGFLPNDDKPKFLPPKGQVPGVYFSPLADWDKLEYGQKIYICESYLKADIVALMGFHAVGVSGVWGWSYEKALNWDFEKIPWRDSGLMPVICFDSNVCEERPKLLQAAKKLRAELDVRCRTEARILFLPPKAPDQHWGIDDFYRSEGKERLLEFLQSEPQVLPNELNEHLKIMNTQVCVVRDLGKFVDIERGIIMGKGAFEDVVYADRMADSLEGKQVAVAKIWTRWDGRNTVNEMVYRPGAERIRAGEFYNMWEGMGCEPLAADASMFTSWVDEVFLTDTERDFFLNWWAWQLQNLGKKLTTSLIVVGKSGIGKGWMTRIAELIYGGKNIAKVPLSVLEKSFNADIAAKQLLVVEETDEFNGRNTGMIYNKLKDMITSTTIRLERKGIDAYFIDNVLNVFLTGNQLGIFKLDQFDRRFMVCEAVDSKGGICNSSEYWKDRWEWIERGGGAAAIYGYLLSRDLSGFDPYGEAPITDAKKDMITMTHDPLETWVEELKEHPGDVMQIEGQPVDGRIATAKELMFVYLGGIKPLREITKGEVMKMVNALKNARIPVANAGGKIKVNGVSERYFLISGQDLSNSWTDEARNREYWKRLVASSGAPVASSDGSGNQSSKW